MKRLRLRAETIRALGALELRAVRGGEVASAGDPECLVTQLHCPGETWSLITKCAACRP